MKKILIIVGVLLFLCLDLYTYYLYTENVKLQLLNIVNTQNIKALSDTLRVYEMSTDELLYAKESFLVDEEGMKEKILEYEIQVKDLKKALGATPTTITQVETTYVRDTIVLLLNDSLSFSYADEWLKMKGELGDSTINIYDINVPVPLVLGRTDDYQVFVTSKNPYILVTDIENNIIYKENKKKHWAIGVNIGPGIYYGFLSKQIDIGIGVSVGVQYNF